MITYVSQPGSLYAVEQLSIRDQFAMAALSGILAHYGEVSYNKAVEWAYGYADALTEARKIRDNK